MANPYQRAGTRRKMIYFGIIAVLFSATFFVRGIVALPLSGLKEKAGKYTIRAQARELELAEFDPEEQSEESQRRVELTGSAVRLLLTGSRGFAVCALWLAATEKQKREEWNEMELTVRSITALQPHFMKPWLFLSWNLAYNVSVEMDRLNDMYFYISRGINLLAEGEALNRYHPDMRYQIAFYYQNKFTYSDKVTTLRSLLHLSCMPADERNPENLVTRVEGKVAVDPAKFKAFCENHPQFVRRLRETTIKYGKTQKAGREVDLVMHLAEKPEDVVRFLRENQKLPTRYSKDDPRRLESRLNQFPVVPPLYVNRDPDVIPNEDWNEAQATALLAARAWYRYANEAVPPPNPVPGPTNFDYRDPERRRRIPLSPMLIIFRQGPPRAQTFIADQLSKDGWFDSDPWVVDEGLSAGDKRWFTERVEIKPRTDAMQAWTDAHTMWSNHGRDNGLNLTVEQQERYRDIASLYAQRRHFQVPSSVAMADIPQPRPDELEDPRMRESIEANAALAYYYRNRQVTNFDSFLNQAEAEMDALTVGARKMIYQAERYQRNGDRKSAIDKYEKVLGTQENPRIWAGMLQRFKKFAETDKAQEDTYNAQLNYLRLVQERDMPKFEQVTMGLFTLMRPASAMGSFASLRAAETRCLLADLPQISRGVQPFWPPGPFDGVNPDTNKPWVSEGVKMRIMMNAGLAKPTTPTQRGPDGPRPKQ